MQVDSPRKQNHLISNLESLKKCCESLGHTVEWRDVDLGENLEPYDQVIVSLAPFASWGTRYMGGVLWAVMTHPKVLLTADDWQVRGIHQSALGLWNREDYFEKTIWSHWYNKIDPSLEGVYRHTLRQAIRYFAYPKWQHKMLVPCWEGGDLSALRLPARELIAYDPSPFMKRYDIPDSQLSDKHHRWIFASLTAKDGWLDKYRFAWPIEKYGNVRQGQQKVPEEELAAIYSRSWGVLSPPHNVSCAGWFRVRFWMASDAGCVMFCGDDEARILGNGPYWVTPKMVEQMDDSGRMELVARQREALIARSWTTDRMCHAVSNALED
jgi:hypothetical protein